MKTKWSSRWKLSFSLWYFVHRCLLTARPREQNRLAKDPDGPCPPLRPPASLSALRQFAKHTLTRNTSARSCPSAQTHQRAWRWEGELGRCACVCGGMAGEVRVGHPSLWHPSVLCCHWVSGWPGVATCWSIDFCAHTNTHAHTCTHTIRITGWFVSQCREETKLNKYIKNTSVKNNNVGILFSWKRSQLTNCSTFAGFQQVRFHRRCVSVMLGIVQKLNFNSVTETIFTFTHHLTYCMAVKSKWRVSLGWRRLSVIFTK